MLSFGNSPRNTWRALDEIIAKVVYERAMQDFFQWRWSRARLRVSLKPHSNFSGIV
jgi:hypothetical protein